jgi:hypothetical protein
MQIEEYSNPHLVTIAVALLGGDTILIDREDIAVRVNEIAPGRFNWRKYADFIDLETVSVALRDAKKTKNGGLLIGNSQDGWMLSPNGLRWIKLQDVSSILDTPVAKYRKTSISANHEEELARLRTTNVYKLFIEGKQDDITLQDFYQFARINEYYQKKTKQRRFAVVSNVVMEDPTLNEVWDAMQKKFAKEFS